MSSAGVAGPDPVAAARPATIMDLAAEMARLKAEVERLEREQRELRQLRQDAYVGALMRGHGGQED